MCSKYEGWPNIPLCLETEEFEGLRCPVNEWAITSTTYFDGILDGGESWC
jgi:hypothetical protein